MLCCKQEVTRCPNSAGVRIHVIRKWYSLHMDSIATSSGTLVYIDEILKKMSADLLLKAAVTEASFLLERAINFRKSFVDKRDASLPQVK